MTARELIGNEIVGGIFFSTVIQGRDIAVYLPPKVTPALQGLPAASPVFAGRETDLSQVLDQLVPLGPAGEDASEDARDPGLRRPDVLVVTAVGGLAGVGKTELAVQAARIAQGRGWFPGGTLFVDMFGYDDARRLNPDQALDSFLRALGIPGEHIPVQVQDRARLYRSILASYAQQGRRILVVIDNASSPEQARDLLPTDGSTCVIVTSRHTLAMLDARLLDLRTLKLSDAVDLLDGALRMARPGDTRVADQPQDARRIAELCGGLPLALRLVAALLTDQLTRSLASMADELFGSGARLRGMRYGDAAVQAAFDLSYRHLGSGQARLFRLLSLNPGPDVSTQAVAVLTGADRVTARRGLEGLARAHLIERGAVGYGRWRLHDLVRSFATILAADDQERQPTLDRLYSWYAHSVNAADEIMRPGRIRPDIGQYPGANRAGFRDRNEALAWCDSEQANLLAVVHTGSPEGLGHHVWSIPLSMWAYLTQTLAWNEWIPAHQAAAEAAERCGAYSGQGWLLNNMATGYRVLGQREQSRAAFAAGLQVRRRLGDLHGQADSLKDMAMAARVWEEFEEALRLSRETLTILEILPARDRSGTASTYDTIGTCLTNLGRLDEAAEAITTALTIWDDLGGVRDDRAWARSKTIMADIGRRRGQPGQAISDLLEALEVFERIHDAWEQADTLRRLGIVHAETDAMAAARDYWLRARECFDALGAKKDVAELELKLRQLTDG